MFQPVVYISFCCSLLLFPFVGSHAVACIYVQLHIPLTSGIHLSDSQRIFSFFFLISYVFLGWNALRAYCSPQSTIFRQRCATPTTWEPSALELENKWKKKKLKSNKITIVTTKSTSVCACLCVEVILVLLHKNWKMVRIYSGKSPTQI